MKTAAKAAKKKKKKRNQGFGVLTIIEMFFSLLMIPVGLTAAQGLEGTGENLHDLIVFLMMAQCVLLSLTNFLRAKAWRYRNQIPERVKLDYIFSGLFLACAIALIIEPTLTVMTIAGVVFMISLIPSRILSIMRNRKWINVVMNVAFILLVLFCMWDLWDGEESRMVFVIIVLLLAAGRGLVRIMSVTFARLRLDLLRNIVQQTYAAEIIFGLILLMASFSFVLRYTDKAAFGGDYANALWYCFAVVTTIGFGDMTATSVIGRILTIILGVYGIVVVALITSIIVNFYGEMKKTRVEDDEEPEPEAEDLTEGEAEKHEAVSDSL